VGVGQLFYQDKIHFGIIDGDIATGGKVEMKGRAGDCARGDTEAVKSISGVRIVEGMKDACDLA